ncbi:protein lethal(2)essential for life-like protein [Dinothrombium tinctorium]|uniref:Protein lethal(2)essential for life-like protein n=1 Tax=Dinothrombium tinctorium TaxID=1965070 RepID=A0A3S4QY85_9ACAR|nr:protein lethal(2)essential for life-like protein [Dinothrombium tinctorium]RWS09199.1 protein lethal(2)essential for life-like protein [Dinothrombium tinctorium]RWS12908.1 protein lethal(2)essential for life-like protein [Dinothrombium tinctorium]
MSQRAIPSIQVALRPNSNYWDLFDVPQRLFDQHFGLGINDDHFKSLMLLPQFQRHLLQQMKKMDPKSGVSEVKNDKNEFRVQLDVSHFTPEELSVKMLDNNVLVVEGKHEEKPDEHGYISRQFARKYMLPQDVDKEKLSSSFTSEGLLVISAPKLAIEATGTEKSIPIEVKHA